MSQPSDRDDPTNLLDPFGLWKQSQEAMLDSWSKSMTDAVNSGPYAETTGRMLDTYLTVSAPLRKIMEQTMTQVLGQLSLPSRGEVVSIAERMTNIEMRLDDLDARLDVILREVERAASAVVALGALHVAPTSAGTQNGAPVKNRATQRRRASTTSAPATARTARGATARSRAKAE